MPDPRGERGLSPRVRAYLDGLPRGLDSYPECQCKAVVLRSILESRSFHDVRGLVPDAVAASLEEPPPVSAWIPETHAVCVLSLARDVHFATEQAFLAWVKERNEKMLHGPLYQALMRVVSPELLLKGVSLRWGMFHRGANLRVELERGRARGRISYPTGLFEDLIVRSLGVVLEVVLEGSGARSPTVRVERITPSFAELVAEWR